MADPTTYRFGRFELRPATRQLLADGGAVTLGNRAFDVLVALVERRERLVTKDELLEIAWPGVVVEENNLQVQISALRKILGPQAVVTLPGRGYRFAMALEDDAPPVAKRPADAPERRKEPRTPATQSEGPRLTAVVFTDVVGYSSRMQKDESGTIALVRADFERMRALCGQYGGESLNSTGDGLLLRFPSVLQAVQCTLQIQREFHARKAGTEQAPLEHRIGIHLGDVFHLETGDVAGDGINIASRLETKAPPGGICLSQTVYDTVKGKLPMRATLLGPESFKNIAEPVTIWQVMPEEVPGPDMPPAKEPPTSRPEPRSHRKRWIAASAAALSAVLAAAIGWYWTGPSPGTVPSPDSATVRGADATSIAVLPFANMSDDKNMGFFADGVQEDLLTQLALLGDLKVVSRTSVAEYRDSKKNARQIASELGVASLVEGSVRRAGGRVRVAAQLIDAHADRHLWAQTYDRELKDIFAIQSELAIEIAKALKGSLSPGDEARLARKPTENLAAYDMYQKYQELERSGFYTLDIYEKHAELLERVVALDPKFALAWARLATAHARMRYFEVDRTEARVAMARQAVERALALAPGDLAVKAEAGNFYYYALSDYARAATYFEELLRAAPNNVAVLTQLSWVKRRLGRWLEANALLERALAIDPRNLEALRAFRENMAAFRHWDEAIAVQRRLVQIRPGDIGEQALLRYLEWGKSGSPAGYVAWRKTLPEAAFGEPSVWQLDFQYAIEEGDTNAAVRLLEAPPARQRDRFAGVRRAVLLLTEGKTSRAHELARSSLREAEAALSKQPDSSVEIVKAILSYAVLGERQAAWSRHRRWYARLTANPDVFLLDRYSAVTVFLNELLGDRDDAFRILVLLYQRGFARYDIPIRMRRDPRVQAFLNDPANNAPLPIVNWDLDKMVAELAPPK